ncbi:hypothetical protein SDC9_149263 [bioreactor metagenome]|uniref:Uncharacterized protein n=1 Tax=bioreactor metagenome TaxID=1076179 RepID=A0A645EL45_9ZZZZ
MFGYLFVFEFADMHFIITVCLLAEGEPVADKTVHYLGLAQSFTFDRLGGVIA